MKKPLRKSHFDTVELFRDERGIGLIVLIMIFGLCTLLAVGNAVSQSEFSFAHLKVTRTKKNEMQNLKYELNFILGNVPGCTPNFSTIKIVAANTSLNSVPILTISSGDTSGKNLKPLISFSAGSSPIYGRLPIKRIGLFASPDATKFANGASTKLAMLDVMLGKVGNADYVDNKTLIFNHEFQIPMYVTTDASGLIKSCHTTQFGEKDAAGNPQTIEEKLCNDATTGKTANWPEDCLACLNDTIPYHLCLPCKQLGKTYDTATKTCI
jgi:hypothetical protein